MSFKWHTHDAKFPEADQSGRLESSKMVRIYEWNMLFVHVDPLHFKRSSSDYLIVKFISKDQKEILPTFSWTYSHCIIFTQTAKNDEIVVLVNFTVLSCLTHSFIFPPIYHHHSVFSVIQRCKLHCVYRHVRRLNGSQFAACTLD